MLVENKNNYESFYEKFIYLIYINKGRTITTQGAHASFVRILSFFYFSLGEEP